MAASLKGKAFYSRELASSFNCRGQHCCVKTLRPFVRVSEPSDCAELLRASIHGKGSGGTLPPSEPRLQAPDAEHHSLNLGGEDGDFFWQLIKSLFQSSFILCLLYALVDT